MLDEPITAQPELYIGLMSGTSLDGADAVLADFSRKPPQLIAHHYRPYSVEVRERLGKLCADAQVDMVELGQAGVELAHFYADTTLAMLKGANVASRDVAAIGCHGQTIRHCPSTPLPFTMQIGDPSVLAESTGITTVAQFRQRDMAAGGQGAPLVPTFHQFLFADPNQGRVVLNLGGIANITWLPRGSRDLIGFDTGPANVLIDGWCKQSTGSPYDRNGALARQGNVIEPLLRVMQSHPYFAAEPPKSTGRETFHLAWVQDLIQKLGVSAPDIDVLRTLTELSAWSVADAVRRLHADAAMLIACGGGAYNGFLLERLAAYLPTTTVLTSADLGVQPDHMEALAFAWLARQTMLGLPGNHPAVTGAKGFRILGGIYPA